MPKKSVKKSKTAHLAPNEAEPNRDLMSTLPLELLAEILASTTPKEILALARCSSYFCNTLVRNPCALFIWKTARKSCVPPVPDPTPNFTEPSYAAYIFDGGFCENCGKYTDAFYKSFSLRLRVCDNKKCFEGWKANKGFLAATSEDHLAVRKWLKCSETSWHSNNWLFGSDNAYYRKADFSDALSEYTKVTARSKGHHLYSILHHSDELKKKVAMDAAKKLCEWRDKRMDVMNEARRRNGLITRLFAENEGWKFWELKNSPSYSSLLKWKTRSGEELTELDLRLIRSKAEADISRMQEKRERAREEVAYAGRREEIAKHYHRLDSAQEKPILPVLNVFQEQPVIVTLQNKKDKDPKAMVAELESESVSDLLADNLSAWAESSKAKFSAILGYPKYRAISEKKLHPVERLTARFVCTRCVQQRDLKKYPVQSLDFRSACKHRCPQLTKRERSKYKWSVDQFGLDQKAIKVTRRFLRILNVSEADVFSKLMSESYTSTEKIACLSCENLVLLNLESMQRHAHRHVDMEIAVHGSPTLEFSNYQPVEWGLCEELMGPTLSAPRKRNLRAYGCRHCIKLERTPPADEDCPNPETELVLGPASGNATADSVKVDPMTDERLASKLYTFDGLRSHIKDIHGVSHIMDEDVFRQLEEGLPALDVKR